MPANYSDIAEEVLDCVEYEGTALNEVLKRVEEQAVQMAVKRFGGSAERPNISQVAKALHMNRTTLLMRMSKLLRLGVSDGQG